MRVLRVFRLLTVGAYGVMLVRAFYTYKGKLRYTRYLYAAKGISVANPGCLSRILICSRIGSNNNKKRRGRFLSSYLIIFLNKYRKKFEPIDKELKYFCTKKFVTKLSEMWARDQGSEIKDPDKILIQGQGPISIGSRIRNTAGYSVFYVQAHTCTQACLRACVSRITVECARVVPTCARCVLEACRWVW
jgi:hypothetical protein